MTGYDPERFLEAAAAIGRRIQDAAIWHEERCNWVGALIEDSPSGQRRVVYKTLGPNLYSGSAGIGLFLGELYAVTAESAVGHAAAGAIRHALSRVQDIPPMARPGLYAGWTGVALAAARVAACAGHPELGDQGMKLLWQIEPGTKEFDILAGKAGAIAGHIVLARILSDRRLSDRAAQFGDELLEDATIACGYSWASSTFATRRNLTGFSHGAAGAGYALLELHNVTKEQKYRFAAQQAFEYERHLFDAGAGNWPDLRYDPHQARPRSSPSFAGFWCHGAPGIGLSRLRAVELLDDATCRTEAKIAAETTRQFVTAGLAARRSNFVLCHGLAGNSEVLLASNQILGAEFDRYSDLALQVAEAGLVSYADQGMPWPCGSGDAEPLGLLTGLAGLGLFYLRLFDRSIPSILLPRPEAFA